MTSTIAHYSALTDWNGKNGLPRFDAVKDEDFAGAFDAALAAHDAEIDAIAQNSEAPSFANTVIALEIAGDELSRVSALFWNKAGAHTNPQIQALERKIAPKMSRHYSRIGMNEALFKRIDTLWEKRETLGLTHEELRVLERHWKGFVRAGAKLPKPEQERLAAINEELALLAQISARTCLRMKRTGSCCCPRTKSLPAFRASCAMPWRAPPRSMARRTSLQ